MQQALYVLRILCAHQSNSVQHSEGSIWRATNGAHHSERQHLDGNNWGTRSLRSAGGGQQMGHTTSEGNIWRATNGAHHNQRQHLEGSIWGTPQSEGNIWRATNGAHHSLRQHSEDSIWGTPQSEVNIWRATIGAHHSLRATFGGQQLGHTEA
ncbi:hypothetical protein DUNSADRAFT_8341 [Dunaliella salina]|uniref:Encoded protein n=1 Tax=Dunaliella salina TaxID=3046 RepID=A0ABQ7H606_DUNSA|nr:hypothetical protein DUNSADRAFT_8341 [Dunaliella salina]|eukprot:KAF5842278.1 hypothetical protein DUNSADRAFT_8341 [Dunaliella salina]